MLHKPSYRNLPPVLDKDSHMKRETMSREMFNLNEEMSLNYIEC